MKTFGVVARPKAPEGFTGVWVNMYLIRGNRVHAGGSYRARYIADCVAKDYRHDCVYVHVRMIGRWNKT